MDYVLVWRVKMGTSELVYNIATHMTLKPGRLAPQAGEIWRANYSFHPPTGVIFSSQGDMPIRFTDVSSEMTAQIVTKRTGGAKP
ncbi:MAG: hypothetical protein JWQ03_2183 [Variovorax sp.]|nr:hypothetical protein [Variovorax sp.]